MSNELTPDDLRKALKTHLNVHGHVSLYQEEMERIADAWQADKQRIAELEAQVIQLLEIIRDEDESLYEDLVNGNRN